jgi:integrase
MPRYIKREVTLSTQEARSRLAVAKKPYFRALDENLHLGYRKSLSGGSWVLRYYKGSGVYAVKNLDGRPDDVLKADGETVLSWNQAQAKARAQFQLLLRAADGLEELPSGPYTVKDALDDYLKAYIRKGGKSVDRVQWTIEALINPNLGDVVLCKLSRRRIEDWHEELAHAAPRLRTKPGKPQKFRVMGNTSEGIRRRRSSANRVLTVLKAALNHAHANRKVANDDAWRLVKAFREVDTARIRYLNDDEARRVVNACSPEFRPMVQAALLTGCRYGELTALKTSDYNPDAGTIHIRVSKSGKPRHVVLTEEGKTFFNAVTAGKDINAPILTKTEGLRWGDSHQQRPFKAAISIANVGALTFHELRHTYASRLVMAGAPLAVVAAQLGHSDTRMVEKHYGHMAPSYVADTVRATFTGMGILEEVNVIPIRNRGKQA